VTPRGTPTALTAYVLHGYPWSESSLIVDLFTREAGRVAVAAKGAKRPTSQLRAVLRPFQRIHVTFGRPRNETHAEVHTLRSAEWAGGGAVAPPEALLAGFYLNELLMKLLPREDPHATLWDRYADTLQQLGGRDEAAALRAFEIVLLREAGLLPDLARVTATQAALERSGHYVLKPEVGVAVADASDAISGGHWIDLQSAVGAEDFTALRRACAPVEAALRRQVRTLLAYHLGSAPLRTREVVRDLQPLLHP
jgi:DNA repair protein RecO (recombination protein O)